MPPLPTTRSFPPGRCDATEHVPFFPSAVDRLGFSEHAYVEAFKETELRFRAEPDSVPTAALRAQTEHVQTLPCLPPAAVAVVVEAGGEATEEQQKER